jgi:hypothetical protein
MWIEGFQLKELIRAADRKQFGELPLTEARTEPLRSVGVKNTSTQTVATQRKN